jgi:signal transduction histidine kinase
VLLTFIRANRDELIRRTREKVRQRSSPLPTADELETGVPLFLTEFTDLLAATGAAADVGQKKPGIAVSAARHGNEMLQRGYTIGQVVHDYGDICQAITELASEQGKEQFQTSDFHTLNLCLDNAIAGAVTEYSRQREQDIGDDEVERLGFLAHELRNGISTLTMAFQVLRTGKVGIGGSTGDVIDRGLTTLRMLVDRSLAEVRLASGQHRRTQVLVAEFIEEVAISASLEASRKGVAFAVAPVEYGIAVEVDRQLLASAVGNLLQNAFKFTPARSRVALRAHKHGDRLLIEVEDRCGGLPAEKTEELFRSFGRRHADTSGLGLGLAISRRSVQVNGGEIAVKNLPGEGCIFTIELPLAPAVADDKPPLRQAAGDSAAAPAALRPARY